MRLLRYADAGAGGGVTRLNLGRPASHLRELAGLSRREAAARLGGSTTGVDSPELREAAGVGLCSLSTLLGRAAAYGLDLRIEVRGRWVLRLLYDGPRAYLSESVVLAESPGRARHFLTLEQAESEAKRRLYVDGDRYRAIKTRRVSADVASYRRWRAKFPECPPHDPGCVGALMAPVAGCPACEWTAREPL